MCRPPCARVCGLFLLGLLPTYFYLILRTKPTLPDADTCPTKGHLMLIVAPSGSGLTTTVRYTLADSGLKVIFIAQPGDQTVSPWVSLAEQMSLPSRIMIGNRRRPACPAHAPHSSTAPFHH